jgi:hypothetical protein
MNPWQSHLLKEAAEDETSVGAYGGHPRGIEEERWPRCGVCGVPMTHLAQMDTGPWLSLDGVVRLTVFCCQATGGRCAQTSQSDASHVVLLDRKKTDEMLDGPSAGCVFPRVSLAVAESIDERELWENVQQHGHSANDMLRKLRVDKFGGGAVWPRSDQTPVSPTGNGKMRLVLQMTTRLSAFGWPGKGLGYVFIDPHQPDDERGVFLWQAG